MDLERLNDISLIIVGEINNNASQLDLVELGNISL